MKQQPTRNDNRKTGAALLLTTAIALWNPLGAGATTPGFNPNADSPSNENEEVEGGTSGSSAPLDTDPFESIVGEIDTGIDDVSGSVDDIGGGADDIGGGVDDITDGNVGDGIEDVAGGVGSITDGIDSITSTINSIFDTVSEFFSLERLLDLVNIELPDIFDDPLGGLDGEGGGGIEIATGPLGLPDPKTIEEEIQNAETTAFQEFAGARTGGAGSPVIKNDLGTLFEREMVDEVAAQTALTEEGQQKLVENSEVATQSLEASQELSEDSESQDVSQNILRNISSQMAIAQQTSTLDTIDRQLQRRDSALRNRMLVNAVRELQADRIQDRRTTAAAYSDAITQGGQLILPGVGIDPAGGD